MDEYELSAKYNIAETCCASVSVEQLLSLPSASSDGPAVTALDLFTPSTPQTYGEIRGSAALKTNLANIYNEKSDNPLPVDNILINPGAIASNFLVLYALVGPGDHVICQNPTYQQLHSVPRSLGAEVSLWEMHEEKDWQLDIEELKALIRPNTKLIVIKYDVPSFLPSH
jgi:aspartate/methionine/tyrosine aminotransferase